MDGEGDQPPADMGNEQPPADMGNEQPIDMDGMDAGGPPVEMDGMDAQGPPPEDMGGYPEEQQQQ